MRTTKTGTTIEAPRTLDAYPDVQQAREQERTERARLRAALDVVEGLQAELRRPADEQTRSTLRIQADLQDAEIEARDRRIVVDRAEARRKEIEQQIIATEIAPTHAPLIEAAVRRLNEALAEAKRANDAVLAAEAAAQAAGVRRSSVSFQRVNAAALDAWRGYVAQESGIDL